jgi:hypothetical protein
MENDKPKKLRYKDIHGTTRVGDFLRSINKDKVINVAAELLTGDLSGAVRAIADSPELSEADKQHAIEMVKLDIAEQQGISERWTADMGSDSWLSKNVRPLSLTFLTVATVILIYIDSFAWDVEVPGEWIDLLKSLLLGVYVAYFGSRGVEKVRAIGNK